MNKDNSREAFKAAFDQAALELETIHREFERLSLRRDHVAKVVEVLKPEAAFDLHTATETISLTSKRAGLTIATRLTVMEKIAIA